MLDERWRAATPAEKAARVDAMFRDCTTMALTGIRLQHPDATPAEVRYQLALRRYGREVADLFKRGGTASVTSPFDLVGSTGRAEIGRHE